MSVIEDDEDYPLYSCHYIHNSRNLGGAVSNCDGDSYRFNDIKTISIRMGLTIIQNHLGSD
jgi:hypothetical protein